MFNANKVAAIALAATAMAACATADPDKWPFDADPLASFDEPWAMTFLPDGRLLVTEKEGRLLLLDMEGNRSLVFDEVPELAYGGQGGLGDVVLHPEFADNGIVYLSYAETGDDDKRGAAVARATLAFTDAGAELAGFEGIWRPVPKVSG
ncbi:MAG: PQQ-dependent sugar dehydrogenase, partial [Woeseiaceae bacterium]